MVHLPFLRLGRAVGGRTSPDISGWRERCGPRTCLGRISALQSLLINCLFDYASCFTLSKRNLSDRFFLYNTGKTLGEESTARNSLTLREVPFSFRLEPDA